MAFTNQDVQIIEMDDEASPFEVSASLQRAINDGLWSLQGSYGRSMMQAIEDGRCLLGRNDFRDYYGNHIPSRDQVQAGTKGSLDFVTEHMGKDWADKIAQI